MNKVDFYELRFRNAFNEWAAIDDELDKYEDEEPEWLAAEAPKAMKRATIAEWEYKLAKWDAEMEAEGVENALEWEKFPEYERVLGALCQAKLRCA